MYSPNSKTQVSVQLGDVIIDYANQQIVGVELLRASQFFGVKKEKLQQIAYCVLVNYNILVYLHTKELLTGDIPQQTVLN